MTRFTLLIGRSNTIDQCLQGKDDVIVTLITKENQDDSNSGRTSSKEIVIGEEKLKYPFRAGK